MIKRVSRDEAQVYPLPGRDWLYYIGPEVADTQRVSVGMAVYPPRSRPTGHVHPREEETIFCVTGRGRIVTEEAIAEIGPGVCVHVPAGVFHATESDGPGPLELVCFFSPPVAPGSYEAGANS